MPKIQINFSIDWEGESLFELKDLIKFRRKLRYEIPITHFICPAYYLIDRQENAKRTMSAIFTGDEIGLHFHALKPLVKSAGVEFRWDENFYRPLSSWLVVLLNKLPVNLRNYVFSSIVSGRGVPLGVYTQSEIKKLLLFSKELLQNIFENHTISGVRVGGWLASDRVLRVIEQLDFKYDASSVPPEIFSQGYSITNIGNKQDDYFDENGIFTDYILKIWGAKEIPIGFLKNTIYKKIFGEKFLTYKSQPFSILPQLTEIPNNLGLSDFVSEATMRQTFDEMLAQASETPQLMSIGCHVEGEEESKLAVFRFIEYIQKEHSDRVEFITLDSL